MKQYRKKPVTIDAVQFDGLNPTEIKDFVGENCEMEIYDNKVTPPVARIVIHTLEGDMEVSKGDYVIKGVKGEFYPCKPDIFQQTYESAETQKELEEEIRKYLSDRWKFGCCTPVTPVVLPNYTTVDLKKCANHFAQWQKEQMLKDAVEAYIVKSYNPCTENSERSLHGIELLYEDKNKPYLLAGDKVRIVMLKEEEE